VRNESRRACLSLAGLWLSLGLAGCGGTELTQSAGPTPVKCQTALSGLPSTIDSSGARLSATVTASRECSWSVTTDAGWIQVSPGSGQGDGAVAVVVAANANASGRSGTIILNDARTSLTQKAAPCRFGLGTSAAQIPAQGGPLAVTVSATSGCGWTVSTDASWIHAARTSGAGSGTADFTVDSNAGGQRTATLTVAGLRVSVTQLAVSGPAPAPAPAPTPSPTPTPSPAPTPEPNPPPPEPPKPVNVKGRVSQLSGSCPTLRFTVDKRDVVTDDETRFTRGKCKDVRDGHEVEVDGQSMANGVVVATRVELKKH
jgi:uncharacterized protein DUF5666/all-beta uncharacterized protein/BACON domain-containing protein